MFAGKEEEEVCVELGCLGKPLSAEKAAQPDKSKAGGEPAWFGAAPVPTADLVCRLCGRRLSLITQVYAPTQIPRSLCVFGCNRAACSTTPEGWRVIRTQNQRNQHSLDPPPSTSKQPDSPKESPTSISSNPTAASTSTVTAPALSAPNRPEDSVHAAWGAEEISWDGGGAEDDWGADADHIGDWGAPSVAAGGVGMVGGEPGSVGGGTLATAAIDALLTEQETRSKQHVVNCGAVNGRCSDSGRDKNATATAPIADGDTTASRKTNGLLVTSGGEGGNGGVAGGCYVFPPRAVNFLPEPWDVKSSRAANEDMETRIQKYREQEEDRALVAALDQALGVGSKGVGNKSGAASASAATGEKYERTPARAKAVLQFAERVARSPKQVVRYAYGGMPLWSASDAPTEAVPLCKCGATRVFEMQLMPALLLGLRVNEFAEPGEIATHDDTVELKKIAAEEKDGIDSPVKSVGSHGPEAKSLGGEQGGSKGSSDGIEEEGGDGGDGEGEGGAPPAPSAEDQERLKTWGMDWGVVAVWSCPVSCDLSCEEAVVVQPPV